MSRLNTADGLSGYARSGSTGSLFMERAGSSSLMLGTNQVVFCVNPVLFENCGLLLSSPSSLTISSVMKLCKESSNHSSISLGRWKEIAVNVIGLRETTAYSVFDVFFAMSGGCLQGSVASYGNDTRAPQKTLTDFRQESNRLLLSKMGGSVNEARWSLASSSRQVSLPGLIIFLLAQLLLCRPPRATLGGASTDFIMNSVKEYLHEYITAVAVSRPGRVTIADAMELRLLLREFANGVEQPFGTTLGFLWPKNEKTIDIAVLSQFIRPRIILPSELHANARGSGRGASVPAPPLFNNIVVRDLADTIYIPTPPVVPDGASKLLSTNFTIEQCNQTSFYIASALPPTRLSALSNCTVALGPVGGVLCVDRCSNCNITALCGSVVVSNCKNVNLFVCTNTPPVLCLSDGPGCIQDVRFAPYNSHYSTLEEHLSESGISPLLNFWNAGLPSQDFLLPPEDFSPICFPIAPQAAAVMTTRTNPCTLPQPYADALNRRLQKFQEISKDLRTAYTRLEEEGRNDLADSLRGKVHAMFVEWLQQSGQSGGLMDLLRHGAGAH